MYGGRLVAELFPECWTDEGVVWDVRTWPETSDAFESSEVRRIPILAPRWISLNCVSPAALGCRTTAEPVGPRIALHGGPVILQRRPAVEALCPSLHPDPALRWNGSYFRPSPPASSDQIVQMLQQAESASNSRTGKTDRRIPGFYRRVLPPSPRQSHLSGSGLFVPFERSRNSRPPCAHAPIPPHFPGIFPAIRGCGAAFARRSVQHAIALAPIPRSLDSHNLPMGVGT